MKKDRDLQDFMDGRYIQDNTLLPGSVPGFIKLLVKHQFFFFLLKK